MNKLARPSLAAKPTESQIKTSDVAGIKQNFAPEGNELSEIELQERLNTLAVLPPQNSPVNAPKTPRNSAIPPLLVSKTSIQQGGTDVDCEDDLTSESDVDSVKKLADMDEFFTNPQKKDPPKKPLKKSKKAKKKASKKKEDIVEIKYNPRFAAREIVNKNDVNTSDVLSNLIKFNKVAISIKYDAENKKYIFNYFFEKSEKNPRIATVSVFANKRIITFSQSTPLGVRAKKTYALEEELQSKFEYENLYLNDDNV